MDITLWFKEYLAKDNVSKNEWNEEDGCVLKAAADLYKATGEDAFRAFVQEYATCPNARANQAMFFAWEQTGEENARQVIEQRMQQPGGMTAPADNRALYEAGPFCMAYEMKRGGMEKVAAVVQMYRQVQHQSDGWRLMALVDAIGWCREELYEHYRALVDMFRAELAQVLYNEKSALVAYSVLRAVRLGVIDPEKYLPIGRGLFEQLPLPDDEKNVGPFIMAYSEYLLAK